MSAFLKLWHKDLPPTLYCLRELHHTLGINKSGNTSFNNPDYPLFNFVASEDSYSIETLQDIAKIKSCATHEFNCRAGHTAEFEAPSLRGIMLVTSSMLEVLARSNNNHRTLAQSKYTLSFQLAGITKTYRLPKGCELSLGSSQNDAIYIPIEGITRAHLKFRIDSALEVLPCGGPIICNEVYYESPFLVADLTMIQLEPSGLKIEISAT